MPSWLKSKFIWLGLFVESLGVIQLYSEELRIVIPPMYFGIFCIVLGIVIKVLRVLTTVPLSEK